MNGAVSVDQMERLAQLFLKYGPFAIAIILVFFGIYWAHRKLSLAYAKGKGHEDEVRDNRRVFWSFMILELALVCASVVWWWINYQREVYVYTGVIEELSEQEIIGSAEDYLYCRVQRIEVSPDVPALLKVHFVVVREKPFDPDETFSIYYAKTSKGKGLAKTLKIPYHPGKRVCLKVEFDPQKEENKLTVTNSTPVDDSGSFLDLLKPSRAWAGKPYQAQLQPNIMQAIPLQMPPRVVLQNERSDLGLKIAAIDTLRNLPPDQMKNEMLSSTNNFEPLFLTVYDLSRHSDRELAYKAGELVFRRFNIENYLLRRALQSRYLSDSYVYIITRLEPDHATDLLHKILARQRRNDVIELLNSIKTGRLHCWAMIPTGSAQGDRYYIKTWWDPRNQRMTGCLAGIFARFMIPPRPTEQHYAYLRNRSSTITYYLSKQAALTVAQAATGCGVRARFVDPRKAR